MPLVFYIDKRLIFNGISSVPNFSYWFPIIQLVTEEGRMNLKVKVEKVTQLLGPYLESLEILRNPFKLILRKEA